MRDAYYYSINNCDKNNDVPKLCEWILNLPKEHTFFTLNGWQHYVPTDSSRVFFVGGILAGANDPTEIDAFFAHLQQYEEHVKEIHAMIQNEERWLLTAKQFGFYED